MATRTGLGYAAAGVIVAGSFIAATAATVGLHAQQAREAPAPSTLQSALVSNTASAPGTPGGTMADPTVVTTAGTASTATVPLSRPAPPIVQPVAVPVRQANATTTTRGRHDDDDDDDEVSELSLRSILTTSRRGHR